MNDLRIHYHVYVVELNQDVLKDPKFLSENPNINRSLPCYYVGITGLNPEERFNNHKRGYKSSRIVKKYGKHLVPELYEKYNPMTYEKAGRIETILAKNLRLTGYGVWQK